MSSPSSSWSSSWLGAGAMAAARYSIPQTIQKRLLKFILKRAVGHFLRDDMDLDNLSVQLGDGRVELLNVELNVEALNGQLGEQGAPLMIMYGTVERITAVIPWKNLWSGNCELQLHGIDIGVALLADVARDDLAASYMTGHDAPKTTMTSSLYLAQDFMQQSDHRANAEGSINATAPQTSDVGTEGLHVLAELIEKILARIRVSATDTRLHIHRRNSHDSEPLSTSLFQDDNYNQPSLTLSAASIDYSDESLSTADGTDSGNAPDRDIVKIVKVFSLRAVRPGHYLGSNDPLMASTMFGLPADLAGPSPDIVLLACPADDKNWVRIKLRSGPSQHLLLDVDGFVRNVGMALDSGDVTLLRSLYSTFETSTVMAQESKSPLPSDPTNTVETAVSVKLKLRVVSQTLFLLGDYDADKSNKRGELLDSWFQEADEKNISFAQWMNRSHCKLSVANLVVKSDDEGLTVSGGRSSLDEWIQPHIGDKVHHPYSVSSSRYNTLLAFCESITCQTTFLQSHNTTQCSRHEVDWVYMVTTSSGPMDQHCSGLTLHGPRLQIDLAVFKRWASLLRTDAPQNTGNVTSSRFVLKCDSRMQIAIAFPDTSNINDLPRLHFDQERRLIYKDLLVVTIDRLSVTLDHGSQHVTLSGLACFLQDATSSTVRPVLSAVCETDSKPCRIDIQSATGPAHLGDLDKQPPPLASDTKSGSAYDLKCVGRYTARVKALSQTAVALYFPLVSAVFDLDIYHSLQLLLNHFVLWDIEPAMAPGLADIVPLFAAAMTVTVRIDQVQLQVKPPLQTAVEVYTARVEELDVCFCSQLFERPDDGYLTFSCQALSLHSAAAVTNNSIPLLVESTPRLVVSGESMQMLLGTVFFSHSNVTKATETQCTVLLSGVAHPHQATFDWLFDVMDFFASEPENIVYLAVANRYTALSVYLNHCILDYSAALSGRQCRALLHLNDVKISSTVVAEIESSGLDVRFHKSELLLSQTDGSESIKDIDLGPSDFESFWLAHEFVSVLKLTDGQLHFRKIQRPAPLGILTTLEIVNWGLTWTTCADSFNTFNVVMSEYLSAMAADDRNDGNDNNDVDARSSPVSDRSQYFDVLEQVDANAFGRQAPRMGEVHAPASQISPQPLDLFEEHYTTNIAALRRHVDNELVAEDFEEDVSSSREWENLTSPVKPISITAQLDAGKQDVVVRPTLDSSEPLHIVEGHFGWVNPDETAKDDTSVPLPTSSLRWRLSIKNINIDWKLHGGGDWARQNSAAGPAEQSTISSAAELNDAAIEIVWDEDSEQGFRTSEEELSFDDHLTKQQEYNDSILGDAVPPPPSLRQHNHHRLKSTSSGKSSDSGNRAPRRATRSSVPGMEFHVRGICVLQEELVRPGEHGQRCKTTVTCHDIEIDDNTEGSVWRKFLTFQKPLLGEPDETRLSSSPMLKLELVEISTDDSSKPEHRLKLQVLPLRMYIDQDALEFLDTFFSYSAPVESTPTATSSASSKDAKTFFQHCDIRPINIMIDYKPKRVKYGKLRQGDLSELLNFFHFEGASLTLCHLRLNGINGWARLLDLALATYNTHVQNTQVTSLLSGLTPVRTVRLLGSGTANLFYMPLEQYSRDGRVVHGMQKGARRFVKTAVAETIKVGAKIAVGAQGLLERLDEYLDDSQAGQKQRRGRVSKYSASPRNVSEGVSLAFQSLTEHMSDALSTILTAGEDDDDIVSATNSPPPQSSILSKTASGAVVKPLIGASSALRDTLLGLQNTLNPSTRVQMQDKYRQHSGGHSGKK